MDATTINILISSVTSLAVCLITVFITTSRQNRNNRELEKLKFDFEEEKKIIAQQQLLNKELTNNFETILEYTQLVKDSIVLANYQLSLQGFDSLDVFDRLSARVHSFEEYYSKAFSKLDEHDKELVHKLKNELHQVQNIVHRIQFEKQKNSVSISKEELIARFENIHTSISTVQQNFREKRLNLLHIS